MPKMETTLTVFVASPSEVNDERIRLEDVINEINLTRTKESLVRLELIKWETHAFPGFGANPQQVINASIPGDYDIFIGIMWHRIGTPTLKAASGTLEEFSLAKDRFDSDPTSVRIMMYFKDAPVPISKIDPEQIRAVHEFRASLGPQGGLYWTFEDTDQFERLVRIHLQKALQEWSAQGFSNKGQLLENTNRTDINKKDELETDSGILDLTIEFSERFAKAGQFMQESTSIMNTATQQVMLVGGKMTAFGGVNPNNIREAKALADQFASVLLKFNLDFGAAANSAADNVDAGIDAMIEFVELQGSVNPGSEEQVIELIRVMDDAQNHIEGYRDKIAEVRMGMDALPPITGEVNRAKKKLIETLEYVVERQNKSIDLTKELKRALFSIPRGQSSDSE